MSLKINLVYIITMTSIKTVDFSQLNFSTQRNKTGRRFIKVFLDKKPLCIKLPKLRLPFNSQLSQYGQLEANVSLGEDFDLIEKIKDLDSKMVDYAIEHKWFKDGVDFDYAPTLKISRNGNYPPTLKIKVPKKEGVIDALFFDNKKEALHVENDTEVLQILVQNSRIISTVECVGVWFIDNRFGLSWKFDQVRVYSPEVSKPKNNEYAFEDSSDNESDLDECLIYDEE
jgi:hypothetical protein